jgi:two-component system chemotaxis response regulator CheY
MAEKVLIVDDSSSVRTVARLALREKGYDVVEASNGQEALTKLDGERCHMLTTEAGEDKKQEGRAAGAKAWITKPFQPQILVDAVSRLIVA